jgi:hypothetical protein
MTAMMLVPWLLVAKERIVLDAVFIVKSVGLLGIRSTVLMRADVS